MAGIDPNKILGNLKQELNEIISRMEKYLDIQKQLNAEISKSGGIKDLTKNTKNLNETTIKLNDQSNQLVRNTKILSDIQKTKAKRTDLETKAGQKLLKEQTKLNIARAKARDEIKKQMGVQNKLTKSFQNAIVKVGLFVAGFRAAFKSISNMVKITREFEKQMDKVAAITGATEEEIEKLKKSAIDLGSRTSKTASEVGKLQEELSKLGFTTEEILAGTGGILALSEATGSDLAQSAKVAASTLRGFGLDATETNRVVDVMAKSFSSSALDLNKFETAMAQVAPVAKNTGVSIEEATAILGTLVDAGLDASTAGTSLRNIFLENSKEGRTFAESMNILQDATDKNAKAMELFGKRGAVAALVIADNTKKSSELARVLKEEAQGAAEDMADIMRDNLTGDIDIARSAWEGLVLSIEDGSGGISRFLRGVIQQFTDVVTAIRRLQLSDREFALDITLTEAEERVKDFQKTLEDLTLEEAIAEITFQIEIQKQIIEDQNKLLKESFKVDLLRSTISKQITFELDEAGKQMQGFIALAENQIILLENIKLAKEKEIKLQQESDEELKNQKLSIDEIIKANRLRVEEQKKNDELIKKLKKEEQEIYDEALEDIYRELELLDELIEKDNAAIDSQIENQLKLKKAELESIEERKQKREELFALTENLAFESLNTFSAILSRQEELTARRFDKEIAAAERAGRDTEEIEKRKATEIAKIQRKQAILNKAAALAEIAINTAIAATKVTAQTGIGAAIAIPLVVASGAAQAAAVLAEPLPEVPSYFKGGEHKGGFAEVHGQELIKTNAGTFFTDWDKYEGKIFDMPKGEIIPNKDLINYDINQIAKHGNIDFNGGISENKFKEVIEDQTKNIIRGIQNTPQPIYEGLTFKGVKDRTRWRNYKDARYR